MAPTVYAHRHAFETMLEASVEMFKRECYGLLFGAMPSKSRPYFIITRAQSMQSLKKLHTGVLKHAQSERRLEEFFSRMPRPSQPIGSFHSHTERADILYAPEMSTDDIKDMTQCRFKIAFIIGITSRKKGISEWRANDDDGVTGSFGGGRYNYNFDIRAYIPGQEQEGVSQIKIVAPEAIRAFNRALGYSA